MANESTPPDFGQKLGPKEIETLNTWLKDHTQNAGPISCPVCKKSGWTVLDQLLEVRPFQGGNMVLGGAVYPFVSIVCTTCAYTMFFNAVMTGVLKPEGQK